MSPRRILALAWVDVRSAWKRPLWLMLTAIFLVMAVLLVAGAVRIGSGDTTAGGA